MNSGGICRVGYVPLVLLEKNQEKFTGYDAFELVERYACPGSCNGYGVDEGIGAG